MQTHTVKSLVDQTEEVALYSCPDWLDLFQEMDHPWTGSLLASIRSYTGGMVGPISCTGLQEFCGLGEFHLVRFACSATCCSHVLSGVPWALTSNEAEGCPRQCDEQRRDSLQELPCIRIILIVKRSYNENK